MPYRHGNTTADLNQPEIRYGKVIFTDSNAVRQL